MIVHTHSKLGSIPFIRLSVSHSNRASLHLEFVASADVRSHHYAVKRESGTESFESPTRPSTETSAGNVHLTSCAWSLEYLFQHPTQQDPCNHYRTNLQSGCCRHVTLKPEYEARCVVNERRKIAHAMPLLGIRKEH